ncbi:MAG: hypothetical protein AVDCRST_MAG73-348, partial [uncultured Thermomicrobiales bacterium]
DTARTAVGCASIVVCRRPPGPRPARPRPGRADAARGDGLAVRAAGGAGRL